MSEPETTSPPRVEAGLAHTLLLLRSGHDIRATQAGLRNRPVPIAGVALLLIRRVAGDAVVNGLVKVPSNKPAVHQVWDIATSLLFALAVALIAYGIVIVAAAWFAGPTRPATAVRKLLAPSLRDSPAVVYSVAGGLLLLAVLWGPTPALRNVLWVLLFAVLLAFAVTMLRRQTALEFPGIEHGQALHDFRAARADARARKAAPPPPAATEAAVGESRVANAGPASSSGRVETLERLGALRAGGVITDEEFAVEKAYVITTAPDRTARPERFRGSPAKPRFQPVWTMPADVARAELQVYPCACGTAPRKLRSQRPTTKTRRGLPSASRFWSLFEYP